ncbi:hypothetical protein L6452_30879 [Arctium lappa]|uniref:Uncharacterized protein n=1 Tax=Arctium lappa TaxID=4217 RepID=A0ACB8ZJQ9_ARCLA|nr:hypothetical protein L6452_30879 [Arctium lappa]
MDFKPTNKEENLCLVSSKNEEAWLLHNKFCNLNFHTLDKLVKSDFVSGLPSIKFDRDHLCFACEMGKLKRADHKSKSDISCTKPLQMLCFVLNDREQIGKFSPKPDEAKFVGYSSTSRAYRMTSEQISSGLKLQDEDSSESSRTNELHHLFEEMFNDYGPSKGDHKASEADVSEELTGTSLTGPRNTSPSSTTFVGTNVEGEHSKTNNEQGSMLNQGEDHLPIISKESTPDQSQNSNQGTTELFTSTQGA